MSTLSARPDRIFISVDESTGRSTISFAPPDVGRVIVHDSDRTGELAMTDARSIAAKHPGCTVHGPHFHAARPPNRARIARKPVKRGDS